MRYEYEVTGPSKKTTGREKILETKRVYPTLRRNWRLISGIFSLLVVIGLTTALVHFSFQKKWDEEARAQAAFEAQEISCLELAMFWEGKRGNIVDQASIAQNIFNRAMSGQYATTVCGVVNEVRVDTRTGKKVAMYSFTFDNRPFPPTKPELRKDWRITQKLARELYADWIKNGRAYTTFADTRERADKSMNYHATYVDPDWSRDDVRDCKLFPLGQIGSHLHYASAKTAAPEAVAACKAAKAQANKRPTPPVPTPRPRPKDIASLLAQN